MHGDTPETISKRIADMKERREKKGLPPLKYGVAAATPLRDFPAALTRDALNIIAELKPASPSRGVIRDPEVHARVLAEVCGAFAALGAAIMGTMESPLKGADGNVEYLLHARKADSEMPG